MIKEFLNNFIGTSALKLIQAALQLIIFRLTARHIEEVDLSSFVLFIFFFSFASIVYESVFIPASVQFGERGLRYIRARKKQLTHLSTALCALFIIVSTYMNGASLKVFLWAFILGLTSMTAMEVTSFQAALKAEGKYIYYARQQLFAYVLSILTFILAVALGYGLIGLLLKVLSEQIILYFIIRKENTKPEIDLKNKGVIGAYVRSNLYSAIFNFLSKNFEKLLIPLTFSALILSNYERVLTLSSYPILYIGFPLAGVLHYSINKVSLRSKKLGVLGFLTLLLGFLGLVIYLILLHYKTYLSSYMFGDNWILAKGYWNYLIILIPLRFMSIVIVTGCQSFGLSKSIKNIPIIHMVICIALFTYAFYSNSFVVYIENLFWAYSLSLLVSILISIREYSRSNA